MQFARVVSSVEEMEIWNASGDGFSFVISYESRSGPGFHGRTGFVAPDLSEQMRPWPSGARPLERSPRPRKPARPCSTT
jgi:hypothetical protein